MQWWDIKNLKRKDFIFSLWGVLFLILPGVAAIAVFSPNLLFGLNWVTLIFLSAAIIFPFVVMNTTLVLVLEKIKPSDKEGLFYSFFSSSLITGLFAYWIILSSYWWHYPSKWVLGISAVIELIMCGSIALRERWREKQRKKKKQINPKTHS
jgi:hypothetical protein